MTDFATNQIEAAQADRERYVFLSKALASWRDPKGLEFDDFERRFLGSYSGASRQAIWLTPGRRKSVDRMRLKYGVDLAMPPRLAAAAPIIIPPADPGCCMFYVKDTEAGGQLRHCNDPAAVQNKYGFLYCKAHEEATQRDLRRRTGKTMILFPYQPK